MAMEEILLAKISEILALQGTLCIDEKDYALEQFSVTKSSIPVRKPTTRGGVYFTDTTAYKIKAATFDLSLISLISKVMLGPNADFKPLKIKTSLSIDGQNRNIILTTHFTNIMN